MFSLLIIFLFLDKPNEPMIAKSKPFETLEMCQNEARVINELKAKGGSIMENTKILTVYCDKLK